MEKHRFQLNEVIERVVSLSRHKMELQGLTLNLELDPRLPEITGDPGEIQQCVINLLFNAMEAIPGTGTVTIRTQLDQTHRQVRLEVEDTGVGVPQDKRSQIFEPFFTTKSQDKGVGLGLSVVYGIIKEHQGTVYVKSELGQGSTFIIRFPLELSEQ
ncbi:MAG: hypothetical protein COT06_06490 [Syntrophobacteraceae bacterium CG07_land_8_20_14_0_80_61_8]|nr:MAG: hypothetical protein COT06_06490 [Syntrophobacteraceae bacterium CG07_land_8_20_14_0_80_61_8]